MPIRTLPTLSLGLLVLLRVLPVVAQEPGPASEAGAGYKFEVHYQFGFKEGPDLHQTLVAPDSGNLLWTDTGKIAWDPADPLWTAVESLELPSPPVRLERPWKSGLLEDPSYNYGIAQDTTLLGALPGAVLQGRTTEEAFHDANRKLQESEELGARNKGEAAEAARREANRIFRAIRREQPEWQPDRIAKLIAQTGGGKDRPEVSGADRKASKLYLQGHLAMNEGLKLEGSGEYFPALEKLRTARELFDAAQKAAPAWQPEIVEYRRKRIREAIEKLERQSPGVHAAEPGKAGAPSAPGNPDNQPAPPGAGVLGDPPTVAPDRNPPHPAPSDHGNREVQELRRRLQQVEHALHESRRREEALRTVVRDLINQMDAREPAPSGPLPQPPIPFRPLPPPHSPAGPPPPPPVR